MIMMNPISKKLVVICDTQPIATEGIKVLLNSCHDLEFSQSLDNLAQATNLARTNPPDILILDKAFGIQAVLDWLAQAKGDPGDTAPRARIVIWGISITEAEALRFLQAGAQGIMRKTATLTMLLACLRTVAAGRTWMEDCVFRDSARQERYPRSELTPREQQVLELVEQGFKNREIAGELGIRPGTVKIHLKHIFEKTGVRGRYGLALNSLKDRGVVSLTA